MKKGKFYILMISSILFIIIILFCIFGLNNKLHSEIFNNIYIENINVSNMSRSDFDKVFDEKNNALSGKVLTIYQGENEIYKLNFSDFDYLIDKDYLFNEVYNFGRTNNILKNNFFILKNIFFKKVIPFKFKYNDDKLKDILKNIDLMIENRVVDDSYFVDLDNNKLILKSGKKGNYIDLEKESNNILSAISNNKSVYLLKVEERLNNKLDLDSLYNNIKKDSVNASIKVENGQKIIINEENGYDVSKLVLKNGLNELQSKDEIILDLNVIYPSVKLIDLNNELYNDKIAGFTTYFNHKSIAKANNLRVGLEKLNEKIIKPNEIFSFNNAIGEISKRTGYVDAPVFKGINIVNEAGGGICQISSTMYNALLLSGFEVIERHNHGLPVGYVLPSRDATVYSGALDLKMKNIRKYPVKIITSFNEMGSINISIYGIKEKEEFDIELVSEVLSTKPFDTKYIYDDTINKNEQIILNKGSEGKTSVLYLIKKLNGNVEKKLISKDTYKPHNEVIKIGIKE